MSNTTRDAATVARLHHVTAIAGDSQANLDFYTGALGLRLVKRTVNFDDPGTYHLYYGDRVGSPGTALTFFPFPNAGPGRPGLGQAILTQFSVPPGSLDFWEQRLRAAGAPVQDRETQFGELRLIARDPDGAAFALVETENDPRADDDALWTPAGVGAEQAIRGLHGVTLALEDASGVAHILTEAFAYRREGEQATEANGEAATLIRYRGDGPGSVLDILEAPGLAEGRDGAGAVHHVAFRVADRAAQSQMQRRLAALGHPTTPQIDRNYFWSVYFRTPGGVLFELATDDPGFTVDEPEQALGEALKLPPQYEGSRRRIEAALPPLHAGSPRRSGGA